MGGFVFVHMEYINKKKDIQCLNCGGYGHTSKFCNCPTTSFGVICFKYISNKLHYVMIQRKDTLSYVEFVRGNYNIQHKTYIIYLFQHMTNSEREYLLTNDFDTVWNNLWVDNHRYNSFYKSTKEKFNLLKSGYYIKNVKDGTKILFSMDYIKDNYPSLIPEQEWEFPKGRRKIGEKDFQCAIREFSEESGIRSNELLFADTNKYFEEVYLSTNKSRYRTIYYVAKFSGKHTNRVLFNAHDSNQIKEVRDVQWFSIEDVTKKLKSRSPEKGEMFKLVNDYIVKRFTI